MLFSCEPSDSLGFPRGQESCNKAARAKPLPLMSPPPLGPVQQMASMVVAMERAEAGEMGRSTPRDLTLCAGPGLEQAVQLPRRGKGPDPRD